MAACYLRRKGKPVLTRLSGIIIFLVKFGCALFGLRSFTNSQLIHKLYVGCWVIIMTLVILYTVLRDLQRANFDMGGLMYFVIYVSQMFAHLAVLLESFFMDAKCERTRKLYIEFEARFRKELASTVEHERFKTQGWIVTIISFVTVIASTVQTVLSWTVLRAPLTRSLQHWHNLASILALQFRFLHLIIALNRFNELAITIRINMDEMGERNIKRVFGPYLRGCAFLKRRIIRVVPKTNQPSEEEDERRLRVYKQFYGEIHSLFKSINEHYGWSILAFMIMHFIYFVVNSYWVIFSLIVQLREGHTLIRNLVFVVIGIILLWALCWQNSSEQSRQIGCLMFKLVKPLGNKSYNDLVTDFSLQTLHQQYVITAKEFFSLNLNLLGSMIASIATYLVILIQFMFTERNRSGQNQLIKNIVTTENSAESILK